MFGKLQYLITSLWPELGILIAQRQETASSSHATDMYSDSVSICFLCHRSSISCRTSIRWWRWLEGYVTALFPGSRRQVHMSRMKSIRLVLLSPLGPFSSIPRTSVSISSWRGNPESISKPRHPFFNQAKYPGENPLRKPTGWGRHRFAGDWVSLASVTAPIPTGDLEQYVPLFHALWPLSFQSHHFSTDSLAWARNSGGSVTIVQFACQVRLYINTLEI